MPRKPYDKPSFYFWINKIIAYSEKFLSAIGYPLYIILEFLLNKLILATLNLISLISHLRPLIKTNNVIKQAISPLAFAKPRRRRKKIRAWYAKKRFLIPVFSIAFTLFLALYAWFFILKDLPNPNDLVQKPRPLTTHIYDRNGNLLFKIYRNQNRTQLALSEIPLHAQLTTIAIEDAEFYTHPGFSLRGIIRAVKRNISTGQTTGGSTITQQLIKNALLTSEKTFQRKIKEVILSILTEMRFSKQEILTMYLNEVSYGGAAYGIEEAAQLYFGKSARNLTLAESALLAGLPAAPTRYSPHGINPQLAKVRQKIVLSRMVEEGFITSNEAKFAEEEIIAFIPQKQEIKAPHFVMWVKQQLVDRYGVRMVEEGGLTVFTSLDTSIQDMSEKVVREEVQKLARLHVGNGAALVMRPQTGEVLAMVGSADYFNIKKEGNYNVTTALRQPGSSIKPINYAYALEHGFTPSSILEDSPVVYNIQGQEPYSPENYDRSFRGKVTLRTSLGSSLNVPAVKVLASYGVKNMIEQGRKMGITTWDNPHRFGLSLTLGGGEVRMTDMAVVYGTLANYGKKVPLKPILKVANNHGKILEDNTTCTNLTSENSFFSIFSILNSKFIPKARSALATSDECEYDQAVDPRVAFLLTDILTDNEARTPTFGPHSLLVIPDHPEAAVKTGTTQNLRDNWVIGYTKDYVVAVWVGNNDNTPMSYIASGVTGATPIWHSIMKNLLENTPSKLWGPPQGVVKIPICTITGNRTCSGCPTKEEWFLEENQPTSQCNFQPLFDEIEKENPGLPEEEKRNRFFERLQRKNNKPN